jgi:hypothetical protein
MLRECEATGGVIAGSISFIVGSFRVRGIGITILRVMGIGITIFLPAAVRVRGNRDYHP